MFSRVGSASARAMAALRSSVTALLLSMPDNHPVIHARAPSPCSVAALVRPEVAYLV
jgi:hypothetical protein